jgi:hypothetical protein
VCLNGCLCERERLYVTDRKLGGREREMEIIGFFVASSLKKLKNPLLTSKIEV